MKLYPRATCLAALFIVMASDAARADRIQLPSDPDISLSAGVGVFIGRKSDSIEFNRIQAPYLRLETTLFNRANGCRWFCRANAYGSVSFEFVDISYRKDLDLVTIVDEQGNEYDVKEDGLERADLSAAGEPSGGAGLRLSLYDHPRLFSRKHKVGLHIDAFGEVAGSFRKMPASPDILLVSWQGLGIDVADLAKEHADLTMRWHFVHYGATIGFPIGSWKGVRNLRLTPFASAGYLHFRAKIRMAIDPEFEETLEALGADLSAVPRQHAIDVDNFSGSVGARLDIGKLNAIETAGSFIATRSGTRVFWATLSYTMRFDYPW